MHELSLCRNLLDIIETHVKNKGVRCVTKITLEIGQLAAVNKDALRFGFEVASKGTVAEGATLCITTIEGHAICNDCHQCVKLKNYYDPCQHCGRFSLTVTQGEELRIQSMEIV